MDGSDIVEYLLGFCLGSWLSEMVFGYGCKKDWMLKKFIVVLTKCAGERKRKRPGGKLGQII